MAILHEQRYREVAVEVQQECLVAEPLRHGNRLVEETLCLSHAPRGHFEPVEHVQLVSGKQVVTALSQAIERLEPYASRIFCRVVDSLHAQNLAEQLRIASLACYRNCLAAQFPLRRRVPVEISSAAKHAQCPRLQTAVAKTTRYLQGTVDLCPGPAGHIHFVPPEKECHPCAGYQGAGNHGTGPEVGIVDNLAQIVEHFCVSATDRESRECDAELQHILGAALGQQVRHTGPQIVPFRIEVAEC